MIDFFGILCFFAIVFSLIMFIISSQMRKLKSRFWGTFFCVSLASSLLFYGIHKISLSRAKVPQIDFSGFSAQVASPEQPSSNTDSTTQSEATHTETTPDADVQEPETNSEPKAETEQPSEQPVSSKPSQSKPSDAKPDSSPKEYKPAKRPNIESSPSDTDDLPNSPDTNQVPEENSPPDYTPDPSDYYSQYDNRAAVHSSGNVQYEGPFRDEGD